MLDRTRRLWEQQVGLVGDRRSLYESVADHVDAATVLYAGSYVDLTPAFTWPDVTFVDLDKRANRFFTDLEGVDELLTENGADPATHGVRFIHGSYAGELDIADGSVDLLVSLYAGLVSEHCTRYLRVGGTLLANASHGDVALASIDDRYRLSGVVTHRDGVYPVRTDGLDEHLVPKRQIELTPELIRERGKGVSYTKSAFAYLFERVA
ncbi:MAG: hypothetical protein AAF548_20310 [Actinomycetota bacterium]